MIRIDDSLLEELGLMALPKAERDQLLRQIYETLEMRVGMRLAERMSDQQLDEFERFIDGDMAFTENYLNTTKPGWQQAEGYQNAAKAAQEASQRTGQPFNEAAVKAEFGALTWLETNFPDYKQVVANELDKLKVEIKNDSGQILQAMQSQGQVPAAAPQAPQQMQPMPQQPPIAPQQYAPQSASTQYAQPQPMPPQPIAPTQPPTPSQDSTPVQDNFGPVPPTVQQQPDPTSGPSVPPPPTY